MKKNAVASQLDLAVNRLRHGDVVAMPTETVYGLAADASNEAAIARVFAIKGRPADRPLIVHVAEASWVDDWACDVPSYARTWMQAFWPGPLTLVLPKQPAVSERITGGQATVALRVPDHPLALALLKRFGGALVAPSANRYGQISPTTAQAVHDALGDEAPLVLDGGACQVGIESTIVSCLGETPEILRPGAISPQALVAAAQIAEPPYRVDAEVVVPGQALQHYAPRTPCQMVDQDGLAGFVPRDQRVGCLGFHAPAWADSELLMVLPTDPELAARRLYAALRQLDQLGLDLILVEQPPQGAAWAAIRDRLQRATA